MSWNVKRKIAAAVVAVGLMFSMLAAPAGAVIGSVSVTLDNSVPSASGVGYTWGWNGYYTAGNVRCVRVQFSTAADGTGGLPTGMVLTSATMSGGTYSTTGSWTRDSTNAASGILIFNNASAVAPAAGPKTFSLGALTNPSSASTYYMTVSTWDTAGSGAGSCNNGNARDAATVAAFATTTAQTAQVTIDPSLGFTVSTVAASQTCGGVTTTVASTSNTVDLGHITSTASHPIGAQSLNITTNAANGYTVYISSAAANLVGQVTARNFVNITGTNASPIVWPANGTEAFGYHTASTTLGTGTANRFNGSKFAQISTTNSEIMYSNTTPGASGDTNCIAFEASAAGNTPADTYAVTLRYNAVPVF